ncbi:hypothetical protein PG994_008221 [Apiospora phragmitis]|uniref:Uncharacterized protein n=1 Tax=Apiospora phragmitis TaxID=2905665 RepID=A0ABR1USE8_9PEZI
MARATPAPGVAGTPGVWNGTGSMAGDIWEEVNTPEYVGPGPLLELYRQIMAPEETFAFCCPSSTVTTRFWSDVTEDGPGSTFEPYSTYALSSVYNPSEIANMAVMTTVAAVPLIHKASDVPTDTPNTAASVTPPTGGALVVRPLAMVVLSMFTGARMTFR